MSKKILLVEDEKAIVEMLTVRLEENGYEVIVAYDGPKALEMAKSQNPDLILLDLTLPKMNGDKVCEELKNDDRYKKIPIILISAYHADQLRQVKLADEFVTKPYDPEELLTKMERFLQVQNPEKP